MITPRKTIKARDPVRNEFSGQSTGHAGTGYYQTKGHAINAFDSALQDYGLCISREEMYDWYGDEGRNVVEIHNVYGDAVGIAVISWYRMPSGNYEFVGWLT